MASKTYNFGTDGKIKSVRYRTCVGREAGKQVFRTVTDSDIPEKYATLTNKDKLPALFEKEMQKRADAWAEKEQAAYDSGKTTDFKNMKFQDFVLYHWKPYLQNTKETKQKTIEYYDSVLIEILKSPRFVDKKMQYISADDIDGFIHDMKTEVKADGSRRFSEGTVKHYYDCLRAIINYADKRKHVFEENPIESANPVKIEDKEVKRLSAEELDLFMTEVRNLPDDLCGWKCMMTIFVNMGLRLGEAVGLKWSDIDFDKNTMRIERTVYPDKNSPNRCRIDTPKSKNSKRVLPMDNETVKVLKEHKAYQHKILPLVRDESDRFVFSTLRRIYREDGKKTEEAYECPIFPDAPTKWINRFIKNYNATHETQLPHFSPHTLRHTCGSILVAEDVPITKVSRFLGHYSVQVTEKFYVHLGVDDLACISDVKNKRAEA